MSQVTGAEYCCCRRLPWRWARRGWPGELGSGCSCRSGGSWAGTPGRSWSASFGPWAGLAGGARTDCQPRSAHRGSTATHRWGPWWAVGWEANTWAQGGWQQQLMVTWLCFSCLRTMMLHTEPPVNNRWWDYSLLCRLREFSSVLASVKLLKTQKAMMRWDMVH